MMSDQSAIRNPKSKIQNIPVGQDAPGVAWRPTPEYIERNRLKRFMDRHGIGSVEELLQRSTADIAWFWDAAVKDLEIEWYTPYTQVVDLSRGIQWPRWFVGAEYNYVHDAVDKHADRLRPDQPAIIAEGED